MVENQRLALLTTAKVIPSLTPKGFVPKTSSAILKGATLSSVTYRANPGTHFLTLLFPSTSFVTFILYFDCPLFFIDAWCPAVHATERRRAEEVATLPLPSSPHDPYFFAFPSLEYLIRYSSVYRTVLHPRLAPQEDEQQRRPSATLPLPSISSYMFFRTLTHSIYTEYCFYRRGDLRAHRRPASRGGRHAPLPVLSFYLPSTSTDMLSPLDWGAICVNA